MKKKEKRKRTEQNKTKITRKREVGRMRIDCGLQIISIEAILKAIVLYIYIYIQIIVSMLIDYKH